MDLRDLAYFEVIADLGHLGRAAERLGRTQPALTKCIQRLEASVGAELFARSSRGLALTQVGEVLLARARRMRTAMDEALREVSDFAAGAAGHVRIGTGATMAEYLLPQVCRALIAAAPAVTVELQIGMSGVLRTALRDNQLDLIIGPVLASDHDEFAHVTFGTDDVVVVAARGHPLCGRPLSIEDLVKWKWVLPAKSVAMRQWLDTVFQAHGLPGPAVQIETNSITMLPRLIGETDLLSFTSTRNLLPDRLGGRLERLGLDATTMRRPLGCVYRREGYLSPAALRVVTLLQTQGSMLLSPDPSPSSARAAAQDGRVTA
ncbi:LysR family transcriptional regulator [Methylobacterium nodulans]|uniref:Transcriptional regulator, LysR family n=1 Tax=Methylobacterium nodulans (strain LMG 21967 / CNCM I-2342 / ORS 2060) TaxID=460265 RepID=B8IVL1_METNO|nr:LysR family transcriptional regulator [Methylobacterium nodulans]ACL62451.1 transcriptional regulator, LysR family [Methylobacterium nodulans ORS 2060]